MKYFKSFEFVNKATYEKYGDKSMRFIDPKIPVIMDFLREELEKDITINDWHWKGKFDDRGLRDGTSSVYKRFSCHSFGRACDFIVDGLSSAAVQTLILSNLADDLKTLGVTGIEKDTDGWTHITVSDLSAWNFEKKNGLYLIPR